MRRVAPGPGLAYGTPAGRWVLAATVAGSGVAFLDATVVNVALPSIGRDLGAGLTGLQWILDGYLVTLSSLLLLGGSLGDHFGRRRMFVTGLGLFTGASALCGLAPTTGALIAGRALQGVGAALLVPGSLALLSASFRPEDRARAVGAWSGLGAVAGAVGPFLGGWLVDAASWRLVFFVNVPVAAVTAWITLHHVPESRDPQASGRPDLPGAATATVGLAGVAYAGLGGALFLVVFQLQTVLGYSALEAGASLLPVTMLMLALSSRSGELAQRVGPRLPMTVGPLVVAAGLLLFRRVQPGATYAGAVLPAAAVFGAGLSLTVAPLTAAVLAAVDERHLGVASGVNNAVARLAGLLAVALLPAVAGLQQAGGSPDAFSAGFARAMTVAAAVCASGGLTAFATVRRAAPVRTITQVSVHQPCHHPCVRAAAPS